MNKWSFNSTLFLRGFFLSLYILLHQNSSNSRRYSIKIKIHWNSSKEYKREEKKRNRRRKTDESRNIEESERRKKIMLSSENENKVNVKCCAIDLSLPKRVKIMLKNCTFTERLRAKQINFSHIYFWYAYKNVYLNERRD